MGGKVTNPNNHGETLQLVELQVSRAIPAVTFHPATF